MMGYNEDVDPVIQAEEEIMLTKVDRGLSAEQMGYGIGESGLTPLRDFLNDHLPPTLAAVTGYITTPDDRVTSEPAVLIVDPRYPILKEDLDGFATVMLHSLIAIVVVRSLVTAEAIQNIWDHANEASLLIAGIDDEVGGDGKAALIAGFAYRSALSEKDLEEAYRRAAGSDPFWFWLTVLCLSEKEQSRDIRRGFELRTGPEIRYENDRAEARDSTSFVSRRASLSDFWHHLIVAVNKTFLTRNLEEHETEEHFSHYASWSSFLDEVIRARREANQGRETGKEVER
jgi:hypothetical protein